MHLELESLLLTDDELSAAKKQIEEMAYAKWQEAGCPDGNDRAFWRAAELEWIEYFYVPDRYPNGS